MEFLSFICFNFLFGSRCVVQILMLSHGKHLNASTIISVNISNACLFFNGEKEMIETMADKSGKNDCKLLCSNHSSNLLVNHLNLEMSKLS